MIKKNCITEVFHVVNSDALSNQALHSLSMYDRCLMGGPLRMTGAWRRSRDCRRARTRTASNAYASHSWDPPGIERFY